MDAKIFDYLYLKTKGYTDEQIALETNLSPEEIHRLNIELYDYLQEIYKERPKAANIGREFVRLTRYVYLNKSAQQEGYPRPDAIKARSGEMLSLPAVGLLKTNTPSFKEVMENRRTLRKYSQKDLSMDELSFLLYSSSWARDFQTNEKREITFRNVPSAGSRHPIETYIDARRVDGLKKGLYYYHPIKHCLILVEEGEGIQQKIYEACLRQEMIKNSNANFIFSAVPYRSSWRYGQRAYRYLYLDAGHIGQNLQLAAEAIGGGACMIGAFYDEAMDKCLGFDGIEEYVIYIATVGLRG